MDYLEFLDKWGKQIILCGENASLINRIKLKKTIRDFRKKEPYLYRFYLDEAVLQELVRRYDGDTITIINKIKVIIIKQFYNEDMPDYFRNYLISRGELDGKENRSTGNI